MSTAIVKAPAGLPQRAVATVEELVSAMDRIRDQANLVSPVTRLDHIPAMHRVSLRMVKLETSARSAEVYQDTTFCKADERAITKVGLLKLWQAAGGSIIESRRLDDGTDPHYCHWGVRVRVQQLDGRLVEFAASKEADLREGSPQIKKATEAAKQAGFTAAQRANLVANAETKALLRAVRGALSLQQKYTVEQLERPFVVPALVPDLDTSDPQIRQMIAAQALGVENALFGSKPAALPPPVTPIVQDLGPEPEEDTPEWLDEPAGEQPPPLPLPMTEEALVAIEDQGRQRYLRRMSTLAQQVLAKPDGEARLRQVLGSTDLMTAPLSDLSQIGHALHQAAQGGTS